MQIHDKVVGEQGSAVVPGVVPAVVFVHAGGFDHQEWLSLLRHLHGWPLRAHLPDLFNAGQTGAWPGAAAPTPAEQAHVLDVVVDAIGEPIHLVGHSYGGGIALRWAEANLSRVLSLAVIEPTRPALLARSGSAAYRVALNDANRAMALCRELVAENPEQAARHFIEYWAGAKFWGFIPGQFRAAMATEMERMVGSWYALVDETMDDQALASFKQPAVIIRAEDSSIASQAMCDALGEHLPQAHRKVVAGSGHMIPLTHPKQLASLLKDHIEAASSR